VRIEEAFAAAGINAQGEPITDSLIVAACLECKTETRADRMEREDSGAQTNYLCPKCGATVVIVGPAPGLTGGYRLGNTVIQPRGGMAIAVPGEPTP
jgi:DNA-directed RNA polymerase subunit RPC12/RpoP